MRIITINLPEAYLKALEILQAKELIPSRSQGVRDALRDFLEKDIKFLQQLNDGTFQKTVRNPYT